LLVVGGDCVAEITWALVVQAALDKAATAVGFCHQWKHFPLLNRTLLA
jgi:hypothetical protein